MANLPPVPIRIALLSDAGTLSSTWAHWFTGLRSAIGTGGGTLWLDGSGAPASTLGSDGDYYLDTTNGDVWLNNGGTWTAVGNIHHTDSGITQLTGDVTAGPGSGTRAATIANNAVTTNKIANSAVTLAKIQNAAASSTLLGSGASGSGSPYAEIALGPGLSMSGTTLSVSVSSVFFGIGEATATTGQNTITLGSTPLAGSVQVFVNGVLISPNQMSISGTTILLSSSLTTGNDVVACWVTTNSTPGGITLSSNSPLLIQSNTGSTLGSSTTVNFSSSVTLGSLLVALGWSNNAGTAVGATVTDTRGNTWTLGPSNGHIGIWYCLSAIAGSTNVTISGGGGNLYELHVMEFAGGATSLDVQGNNNGVSNTGSATTSSAVTGTDLVVFGIGEFTSNSTFSTPTGYTSVGFVNAGFGLTSASFYRTNYAVSGTQSATTTLSSSDTWQAVIAAFKR